MANQIDTDAKIIAADAWGFGQPALCRCSSTLMFAAHINDSSQLEIHKSVNNGSDWSLVKTFTETDLGDFELAAIDSTSAAIVFTYTGNGKCYITTDSGSNWTEKWTDSVETKYNIAYDSLESRLWISYISGTYIQLRYSDNNGDSWTSGSHNVSISGYQVIDLDINPTNSKVYVVVRISNYLRSYIFSKTGVYESISVNENASTYDGCIVIDSVGNEFVLTGARLYISSWGHYIACSKNGSDLNIGTLFGGSGYTYYYDLVIPGSISVSVDGDDNIYAFYTKASDEKTYYRKFNGSSWESEVEFIATANDRISTEKRPISGSDKLHYVYYKAP